MSSCKQKYITAHCGKPEIVNREERARKISTIVFCHFGMPYSLKRGGGESKWVDRTKDLFHTTIY
jgi:hypothetical protein